ncbi:FxLD family lanthipeptide [Dactylosporangium cerinum]|uniref:FxLD family lanthipeptide n=1 Tax=Dactylosporangium cerinum TaxID=1434730 RepID=A0ABV9WIR8_9ACTN
MTVLVHPGRTAADAPGFASGMLATTPLYPDLNGESGFSEDDFELDMTVVESTTPLVQMMCSTSDGCGSSCSTSACTTKASDPL